MIKNFKCKETKKLFDNIPTRKLPNDIQRIALRKLKMIDAATRLETLKVPPGNRLEALQGDRKGQHSVRINGQWRICFEWKGSDTYNVEIVDYH